MSAGASPHASETVPTLSALSGLWRRSVIIWPDGASDAETRVRWLQGPSAYADLRQPATLPDFSGVRALTDLSLDDCMRLAEQEGFAGRLVSEGSGFEWQRSIDFQPRTAHADAGSLHWEQEVLVERGLAIPYVEHWHRDPLSPSQPLYALTLRDPGGSRHAVFVRAGPHFMFARERTVVLPAGQTLGACVARAPSLRHATDLIDCEISLGAVEDERFRIAASTLPHRISDDLCPRYADGGITTGDRASDGEAIRCRWDITSHEGECEGLLAGAGDAARDRRTVGAHGPKSRSA